MLSRYGFRFEEKGSGEWYGYGDNLDVVKQQIALANPLYLTQVGWIYHTSAPSGGAGEEGRIWSSTPAVKEAEAFWIVGITKIYPSSMHAQIIGHSLRF